jgi:ribonucleoside-diphosphate reductase alpha chain
VASRLPDSLLPPPEELSKIFSEVTGDPEKLDKRDRLLLSVWEEKVRPKILQRAQSPTAEPHRWKLPDERKSITARFEFPAQNEDDEFVGYITTGMYDDEAIGEIFLEIAKEGSFVSGIMDAFVTSVSIGLQHGIPLSTFARKFKHAGFGPSGMVIGAPEGLQGFYKSVLDYLFHYLEHRYPDGRLPPRKLDDYSEVPTSPEEASAGAESAGAESTTGGGASTDASDGEASGPESDVMTSAAES